MVKKSLAILAVVLLIGLGYTVVEYFSFVTARDHRVQEKVSQTTIAMRDEVDAILARIVAEGERLAERFGQNEYRREEVEAIIKESSLKVSEIQGVTAAYEPNAFSDSVRLFSPYYNKGTHEFLHVEEKYDYTDASKSACDWYTQVRDGGARWVEPYYATGGLDWYVDYGIPFYYGSGPKEGQVRGTITLSFVCSGLKDLAHSLSIGKTGYGIITSSKGQILAHPIEKLIGSKNLKDVEADPALAGAFQKLLAGESGTISFYDAELRDQRLFCYDQIPTSKWGIGLMFFESDLLNDQRSLDRRYIHIAILLSLFFVCLLAMYYNKDYLDEGEIWRLSFVSSLLLLANIVLIGFLRHHSDHVVGAGISTPIVDMSALGSFVSQQQSRAERLRIKQPTVVPTGVYLERLEFADSYNLNASGTIWQKYPLNAEDEVQIGFHLPQLSPFAESSLIEESYRVKIEAKEGEAGHLLVGWDFRVTLRLNLRYSDFPFDKRQINIEIVPLDKADRLLFVPDLASYKFTNPSKKCGLSNDIEMSGSEVVETFFNVSTENYDADFGFGEKSLFEDVPVLHFNVQLRRILLTAFVTYLIPIAVTLFMIFLLVYACRKTTERQGIIESMAAFCFVLIFSHIDLRREIVTADLVYIEYFYFITYVMVIVSTFNLITYSLHKNRVFDFNDNQIYKSLFFPVFFLSVLAVTLAKFY